MRPVGRYAWAVAVATVWALTPLVAARAQGGGSAARPSAQPNDEEYTKKIKEYLQDPRITTELVDHLPASNTVPTPLKFLGRVVGQPGELTYAKDIYRYFDALDAASDRIKVWRIGKTEEGRDIVVLAVADEATIRDLDKYKGMLNALTDPRKTTEEQARGAHEHGEADLLVHERHALARDGRPGDAHGTRVSPRRRGDAVHPEHPEQRHHVHHAGHRG
jgi:hypothetical protein